MKPCSIEAQVNGMFFLQVSSNSRIVLVRLEDGSVETQSHGIVRIHGQGMFACRLSIELQHWQRLYEFWWLVHEEKTHALERTSGSVAN